jgi:CHASE2 domain-containing sensor protein
MTASTLSRARTRLFPSSLLAAAGLVVGFGVAQETGNRPLGGAVLAACGVAAGVLWLRRRGWGTALALAGAYLAAFVLSHVLALGAGLDPWVSVALVTIADAGVTYAVADRSRPAA